MINEFIENFRQKHGFNHHTAILPPDEATMLEEDPDKLEDLGAQPKKRPAPKPDGGEGGTMGLPPRKKPKKAKQVKTPKPKKDPKLKQPKKGKKSKKAAETGDPGQMLQTEEQDPTPGCTPGPMPPPRPGDTDPLEGKTPPLRPEGEPTPLGTDPGQVDVRVILLPPRLALPPPPPHQPTPPPEPQPQPKPPTPPKRATPPPTPGCRTPPGGETDPSPSGNLKTRDIPLQADKEVEMGMTALPLVAMEETMVMEGTVVMERIRGTERTVVTEKTVVTGRTVVMGSVWRATAIGTTAKMETATMMMGMKSPNTVA